MLQPENDQDSSYLYRKKLLTVNGMHTVIAFRQGRGRVAPTPLSTQPPAKAVKA